MAIYASFLISALVMLSGCYYSENDRLKNGLDVSHLLQTSAEYVYNNFNGTNLSTEYSYLESKYFIETNEFATICPSFKPSKSGNLKNGFYKIGSDIICLSAEKCIDEEYLAIDRDYIRDLKLKGINPKKCNIAIYAYIPTAVRFSKDTREYDAKNISLFFYDFDGQRLWP